MENKHKTCLGCQAQIDTKGPWALWCVECKPLAKREYNRLHNAKRRQNPDYKEKRKVYMHKYYLARKGVKIGTPEQTTRTASVPTMPDTNSS